MNDTPRTDQVTWHAPEEQQGLVPAPFARELERENAALRADNEELGKERDLWKAKTEQLIVPHYILDPDLRAAKFRDALAFHPVVQAAIDAAKKEQP